MFALPVFAPYAPSYQVQASAGLRLEKLVNSYTARIREPKLSEASYTVWFRVRTLRFSGFWTDHDAAGDELPRPELARFLREALAQIEPDVPRPDLSYREWGARYELSARRVAYGRPIGDELRIGVNVVTGRLGLVESSEATIDPAPYGDDPILGTDSLREFGHGQYAGQAFPQAELVTEETVIDRPHWIKREPLPRYAELGSHGIPTYVMKWETPGGSFVEVQMDARDGTVFHAIRGEAMGSGGRPPLPVPGKVRVGKTTSTLARSEATSESPSGSRVTFLGGKTVFSEVYGADRRLWYRPDAR